VPPFRRALLAGAALGVLVLGTWAALAVLGDRPDQAASPASRTSGLPLTTASPTPTPTPTTSPAVQRVFPVLGEASYGQTHHGYPGTDIFAPCGATYVAAYSGVVHEVNRVDRYDPVVNDGATRGGLSVAILGDDGVRYYGSHFQVIADGIEAGVRVDAGEPVATVGETGDASACHVHFGLSPVCAAEDWFVRRGVIWPWPYLDSWRAGGNAEPAPEIQQWLASTGCPDAPTVEP
jgi:murein DD-endopeptidase MepM/ murein hydrolase activator NlpD